MPGWQMLPSYSAAWVLVVGAVTALGLRGLGLWMLRLMRIELPEPWHRAAGFLLGVLTAQLLFEALAMAHLATKPLLIAAWALATLPWLWPIAKPHVSALFYAPYLAVALAPLTHQDELNYHALIPARIVADGGLTAYRMPWEATVWPQLGWHILQAPLFAMGLPNAASVLSMWTTAMLIWFVWAIIAKETGSRQWAALCCAGLLASGFSIALCTSMGPHAFGYFATTVGVLAALMRIDATPRNRGWLLAIAAAAMVSGKLTMTPAALIICAFAPRALLAIATFLGPIAVWSWAATGSPFGIVTAELFHAPFFDAEAIAQYHGMQALSLSSETFLPIFEAANWSGLLWLGCAAFFLFHKRDKPYWTAAALFIMQALLLTFAIALQLRFLGGIQYALCVAGILAYAASGRPYKRWYWLAVAPWICVVVWISATFWRVSTGIEPPRAFLERYAGLFSDYEALDRLLPTDAVILIGRSHSDARQIAWLSKPPAFYSPRQTYFDHLDVPDGKKLYLLWVQGPGQLDPWLPDGYRVGERVYANPAARFYPSRTPAGVSDLERVEVYVLLN
jgi:hypothetical protein